MAFVFSVFSFSLQNVEPQAVALVLSRFHISIRFGEKKNEAFGKSEMCFNEGKTVISRSHTIIYDVMCPHLYE